MLIIDIEFYGANNDDKIVFHTSRYLLYLSMLCMACELNMTSVTFYA